MSDSFHFLSFPVPNATKELTTKLGPMQNVPLASAVYLLSPVDVMKRPVVIPIDSLSGYPISE
jgi:hypothetical protein